VKNGHNPKGKQQYRCKQCGKSGVLDPEVRYTAEQKERILAPTMNASLRGIERVFGVRGRRLPRGLKKAQRLPPLTDTLLPSKPQTYWNSMKCGHLSSKKPIHAGFGRLVSADAPDCRIVIGDRSDETCRQLWKHIRQPTSNVRVTVIFGPL